LLIALDNLDAVIDTIRRSRTVDTARENLRSKFKLSEIQARAILEMPLKRLAALERQKLQAEFKELQALIAELTALLAAPEKQREVIRQDLVTLRARYTDARRTHILAVRGAKVEAHTLTPDQPVWVTVSQEGHLGRLPDDGKTPPKIAARPAEAPLALQRASTRAVLYLFTTTGETIAMPVHQMPEGEAWEGGGALWTTLLRTDTAHRLLTALTLPANPPEDGALFFATARGQVKRLLPAELPGVGRELTSVIRLETDDTLVGVSWVAENDTIVLGTAQAQGIRFAVNEVRPTGAKAGGMSGIRLEAADTVVSLTVAGKADFVTVSTLGYAKRNAISELPSQKRGGKGIQIARFISGEKLAGCGFLPTAGRLILISEHGTTKTLTLRTIPEQGRTTRGSVAVALTGKDTIVAVLVPS